MSNGKIESKVVHISTWDNQGGGSLAALRLHTAMLEAGIDSKHLVHDKRTYSNDVIAVPQRKYLKYFRLFTKKILKTLKSPFIGRLNTKRGSFEFFEGYDDVLRRQELLKCDIIYLHGVFRESFNYNSLKKLFALNKKVFWFLHDNFVFTGGCLYPLECGKYTEKCCKCQFWEGFSFFDCAKYEFNQKNKILNKADNLTLIAPSFWILDNAKRSVIAKNKRIYHIPNLVNPKIYKPIGKNSARKLFSIGQEKRVIGFGAIKALTSPYKGWEYIKSALEILKKTNADNENIEVMIFGSNYQKEVADTLPFKTQFTGFLSDDYSMAMMYNAIDVFVAPSLADNFPQTILESLACNTPVVAFDTGGIPDMVNEKTGYLAKYKDSNDLAYGINLILSEKEKRDVCQFAQKYFTESILQKHIEMWRG